MEFMEGWIGGVDITARRGTFSIESPSCAEFGPFVGVNNVYKTSIIDLFGYSQLIVIVL